MTGAPDTPLRDVHEAAHLPKYLRQLWSRRAYVWHVATNELRSRQMASVLGNLWHLLNPILQIAVFYVIFGLLLEVDRGVDNFLLFLTVGVFVFSDIQRATVAGAGAILNNRGLVQALNFPRALLPVTSTLTETLATLPSLIVVWSTGVITGESPRWHWGLLPVVIGAQALFNLGLALFAARAATHFEDVRQILPFLFRILLYGSGVIFSVDAYAEGNSWSFLFTVNPVYCWLSLARATILGGGIEASWLLSVAIWTVAAVSLGLLWFKSAEDRYGRV